jgi:steroid delta-isomerase-like uncharacterized protein
MEMRRIILSLAVTVLAGGLLVGNALAQDATPAPASAQAEIVLAYEAALNLHDAEQVAALYSEDAVVEQAIQDGNVFTGREEITTWIDDNLQGIPDLTVETQSIIVEANRIAWEWIYQGTYTGQFPGAPAGEGQPIFLRAVSLLEIQDGLIVRETIYFDNEAFMTQIGALPGATPAATPEAN